jgi:ubiquinone/menaquinone biosynthesis C-methylase UbiE
MLAWGISIVSSTYSPGTVVPIGNMYIQRLVWSFFRWGLDLLYNPFAFAYDLVSVIVSRGHWRDWTRAAIPHIVGSRVLEIPCGTGNLLLDMCTAGHAPIGVDLSPSMLRITQNKFYRTIFFTPILRARAQALPFATSAFDSIVMTFPPPFVYDPRSFAEIRRILADDGRLIWVDAGRLTLRDPLSRILNRAFGAIDPASQFPELASKLLAKENFSTRVEWITIRESVVAVAIACKLKN